MFFLIAYELIPLFQPGSVNLAMEIQQVLQEEISKSNFEESHKTWNLSAMSQLIWGRMQKDPNEKRVPYKILQDGKEIGFATVGLWGVNEHFDCALRTYKNLHLVIQTFLDFYRSNPETFLAEKSVLISLHPSLVSDELLKQGWKVISQNHDSRTQQWIDCKKSGTPNPDLANVIGEKTPPEDAAARIQLSYLLSSSTACKD